MVNARLEITPPETEWYVQLSTELPDDTFTLLTIYDEGSHFFGIFEVETADLSALLTTLNEIKAIIEFEVLHTDDGFAVVEYRVTESVVYSTTVRSGTLPPASVTVQNGVMLVEIKIPHGRLSGVIAAIRAIGGSCELLSLSRTGRIEGLLTTAQQRFVTTALRHGYYDTPRRCTLTELASVLEVTPAAASTMAHRTEERIIKEFVQGTESIRFRS
ncbi:DNA-binding protein [Salinigranum rubrum]|uniref:DNA-binding protein n=1 Tax=Salinigranum rubrum TaxID=755307 RepID=A0A2I8VLN7_9EURY|nr:helix-turn-helix domain-containing protein [Salinigranum rubrum]AUV82828.1 DNA-binding protein [Salinigranum rubrum]